MLASCYMRLRLLLISILVLALGACRPDSAEGDSSDPGSTTTDDGVQLRLETASDPQLGNVPVNVYLLKDGEGVSGAKIEIVGDMTHSGMVPVITNATETEAGLYTASDFEFTMAGDWIITAEIDLPDGESETVETNVTVPGN